MPEWGEVHNPSRLNTAQSTKFPVWRQDFGNLVDIAPNRGYNEVTSGQRALEHFLNSLVEYISRMKIEAGRKYVLTFN